MEEMEKYSYQKDVWRDYSLILETFSKIYPSWITFKEFSGIYPGGILFADIERLIDQEFFDFETADLKKPIGKIDLDKVYFRISQKGLNFLGLLASLKLNKNMRSLTIALIIIGIGAIFFSFIQNLILLWI